MKTDTVNFFERNAGYWDQTTQPCPGRIGRLLDSLGSLSGKRVLDVGCGTGVLFRSILDRIGPAGNLAGLDPSGKMLGKARENCSCLEVLLVQGFAESMPFETGSFDAVVLFSCFPHLADPETALSESARVLSPGGRILIGHASGREHINSIHRDIGGAVADHLLQPAPVLAERLISAGFEVDTAIDGNDLYCITGTLRKKPWSG